MKIHLSVVMILLVLLLACLLALAQPAHAQGPVDGQQGQPQGTAPTPPPPVTPQNPVDAANEQAAQWQAVANQAVASAQASINQAYASLAAAQSSVWQYQQAYLQAEAARQAAVRGQLQAASDAAHAAQVASVQAIALASEASRSAMYSLQQAGNAINSVPQLRADLTAVTAQRDTMIAQRDAARVQAVQLDKDRTALAGALVAEQQRSDLYGKVAISALLLLAVIVAYVALVLWKLIRALKIQGRDRMVVLDERGRVKAQIEAMR
jgi:hypothetical protein